MEQGQLTGDRKTYEQEGQDSAIMLAGVIFAVVVLLAVLGAKGLHLLPLNWPWTVVVGSVSAFVALLTPAFLARNRPRA